jgi:methyl-accepting chemotaxis protein
MSDIKNIKVKNKLLLLVAAFGAGFMVFGFWAYNTMSAVKINGDQYQQIIQGKDLIADILPPPEYIIEAYLVTLQMVDESDRTKLAQYIERGKQLRKDFEDRHSYWDKELATSTIKTKMMEASYKPAIAFFELRDQEFIPALQAGDTKKAKDLLRDKMAPQYEQHRAVIDEIVPLAAERSKADEQTAAALISSRSWQLIGLGILILLTVSALCWIIARSVVLPLSDVVHALKGLSVGNLNQKLDYEAKDEIGDLAQAFRGLMSYIKTVSDAAHALGEGNLQVQVTARSEHDVLSQNFQRTLETLRGLMAQINHLSQAAQKGDLKQRSDASKFQGVYQELVSGFNQTLDAMVTPVNEALDVLQQIAKRDLTVRMKGEYKGDFAHIKQSINEAGENLSEALMQMVSAAEQVNSAANEISSGSQSLAQGASEQASSLEEVSSSLQQMNSMIKQNAANAKEARGLTEAARQSADKGVLSMQQLSEAVNRIKHSSDATAKIVKTIDEIAFQTNLLALNAAVEAARAGDAGKGFAVVAEEVRNLAMRSAEAAKNTAELIEGSVKNAQGGVVINAEVMANLEEINKQVNQVSEVMAEIAAASDQQSQGVEQISAAIGQMNQVTQQTAANSEESAAAAEQLSGQSEEMLSMVGSFQLGHTFSGTRHRPTPAMYKPKAAPPKPKVKTASAGAMTKSQSFSSGDELIPFDDLDSSATLQEF